jgi:hypothetical protein
VTGTSAALRLIEHGFAVLQANVDLQPSASGTWVATGLTVALPAAGTYQLDATIRAAMTAVSPANVYVVARLYDVTAGAPIPGSETMVHQINIGSPSGATLSQGTNNGAPVQIAYTVPGPRTIRVEAARYNSQGATATAAIISDGSGRSTLRVNRIA